MYVFYIMYIMWIFIPSHKGTPINTCSLKMTSVVQISLHHRYFQSTETISSLTDNKCHSQRMLIKIIVE